MCNGGALTELKKGFGEKVTVCGVDVLQSAGLDEFVQGDANKVSFPQNCDLVISFRTLHEIANLEKIFEKLSFCMVKGAKGFLSIRCQQQIGKKTVFHGNLRQKDFDFLRKIIREKKFKNFKVLGIEIEQTPPAGKKIIAGVNVFLIKS